MIKRSLLWVKVKKNKIDDDDAMKKYMRAMGGRIAEKVVPRCTVCKKQCTKAHAFCTKDMCM